MKKSVFIILFISLLISCSQNEKSGSKESTVKEAMDIALSYAREKFNEPRDTIYASGIVTVEEGQVNASGMKYYIDPGKIMTGLIDDDENEDAIISLDCFSGNYQTTSEHLILINKDDKITFNRAVESNMIIIEIKDRLITADVPTHSRNNPLFNCKSCREVINYQFRNGELIKMN